MNDTALCYSSVKTGSGQDATPNVVVIENGMVSVRSHKRILCFTSPENFKSHARVQFLIYFRSSIKCKQVLKKLSFSHITRLKFPVARRIPELI